MSSAPLGSTPTANGDWFKTYNVGLDVLRTLIRPEVPQVGRNIRVTPGAFGELHAIRVEQRGPVLIIAINRPDAMNSLCPALYDELEITYRNLDPDIRAIVFTGSGHRAFCTGMDVKNAAANGQPRAESDFHTVMKYTALNYDVWLPFIVAVNGVCAGAGLNFLADADVVLAADHATFVDPHVNVGQVSALEPLSLLLRIGLGNVLRLAVLGRAGGMNSEEALRISLVDEVVPAESLLDRAVYLANEAAKGSPAAIVGTKKAIRGVLEMSIEDAMQKGYELLGQHRHTHPDAVEGPLAFAERRAPHWLEPSTGVSDAVS